MNSCECSEHMRSITSKAEFLQKFYQKKISKNFTKFNYYNAITIRLNTHPSSRYGVTNEELVLQTLNEVVGSGVVMDYCWEMTKTCQLHLHALSGHSTQLYRKEAIMTAKEKFPGLKNYSIHIVSIKNQREVMYWLQYLHKGGIQDVRPLYYRLTQFYHDPSLRVEDFEDLADYDIEYNTSTKHFNYVDSSKVKFMTDNKQK